MTPRWRLFPKYALLIIALVGGLLIASGATSIYFSWRETERNLIALQAEKAQAAAARIEQYILDIEHQLGWTTLPALDEGSDPFEPRRTEYQKLFRLVPAITEVAWIDPNGREQVRISRVAVNVDGSNDDYSQSAKFKVAKGGATYYGPVYFRKETEPYMTIARPAGLGGGVTAAEVNLKFVWEVVSRIRIGEKGLAWVVDDGGVLIAHPDISLVLRKTDLSSLPQVAALRQASAVARKTAQGIDGGPVLSANAAIPTLNWTVFVEAPEKEAFAPLYASILRAGLLLGAGLLVSMVASFFVARALVRPLQALQEGAARIGAGELDRRIEVRTGDELEGLAEQFNQMGAALKESYAGLERKVAARTAELSEALEQQTATAEVLRVISRSQTDVQPVFDTIAAAALRLCEATSANVVTFDGSLVHVAAVASALSQGGDAVRAHFATYPRPPSRDTANTRAILTRSIVMIPDVLEDPDYGAAATATAAGYRSILAMPLMSAGKAIGAITVARPLPGPVPDKQVSLLQTFADQAVIAIENVRLFNETKEALERQTATAEILRVISSSPSDVQPVFDAIAKRARLLCAADSSAVRLPDGEVLRVRARDLSEQALAVRTGARDTVPIRRTSLTGRAFLEARSIHVEDVQLEVETEYPDVSDIVKRNNFRTVLVVPMLRDGRSIGTISLFRYTVRPFSATEIDLVKTFADQAVIAIENVRLFNETNEALERQTATAEVLKVISSSVSDAAPVFETILESCQRLFSSSEQGVLLEGEDGRLHLGAHHGRARELLQKLFPVSPQVAGASRADARRTLHFKDILNDADVPAGLREIAVRIGVGSYSQVIAPMMWEGESIGSLYVIRQPPVGFSDKEIGLLRTFADQAVIAIQNSRLFNETREALEQQTATAEILQVISRSVADSQPVFEAILRSCERLFNGAHMGITLLGDDGGIHLRAHHGPVERLQEFDRSFPVPLSRESGSGSVILDREVRAYEDVDEPSVPATVKRSAAAAGTRSVIFAPLLWEGRGIGAIFVGRKAAGAFSAKDVALIRTLADQAVIAIQNARLFNETKEALEQQTATAEILRVMSSSPTDVQPVFDAIADRAMVLCGGSMAVSTRVEGDTLQLVGYKGTSRTFEDAVHSMFPVPIDRGSTSGRAILTGMPVQIADVAVDPEYRVDERAAGFAWRSTIAVPMVHEGRAVGAISVARAEAGAFAHKSVALLETFARQAVLAIENVRLFNETREALEQQTATAEVLQVISSSVADTQPVFDKILDSCERLFAANGMGIYLIDDSGRLHMGGFRGQGPLTQAVQDTFPRPLEGTATALAIKERRVVHFADVLDSTGVPEPLRRIAAKVGNYSIAFAPMLWEGRGVGAIQVSRIPMSPFNAKELTLLKTFADQAVIAIQNARLFNEIQSKSRELELANKHKSEFLANMSHELRTPLNAIIGFSEVLSEKMFGEVNDKQLEYLLDIHTSGHHLLSLINDILDLSKIEAGRMELDLASTSLPMLLDNCTTLVRERASRNGLVLALEVEDGLGEWVADVRKLKQVVINLLSNAVKFTPAGGRVTLRARRLDRAVEIAVIDTGVGIAKDQQALVFEEFRQAGGDYLRKAEGTGLGLSLARRFVELHGGTMRVESEPGRGSTFSFVLPERVLEAAA